MSKPIEDKANEIFVKIVRGFAIFFIIVLLLLIFLDLATIVDIGTIVYGLLLIATLLSIKGWK